MSEVDHQIQSVKTSRGKKNSTDNKFPLKYPVKFVTIWTIKNLAWMKELCFSKLVEFFCLFL